MKKKIWITKDRKNSCVVVIWLKRPVWRPNPKKPCARDSGHWSNKDGSGYKGSHHLSWNDFWGLFRVRFKKKVNEGFIAERSISLTKCKG